jgi:hypothetical protein
MATRQTTIRFSPATDEQLSWLAKSRYGDITKVVAVAVALLYQQERRLMLVDVDYGDVLDAMAAEPEEIYEADRTG